MCLSVDAGRVCVSTYARVCVCECALVREYLRTYKRVCVCECASVCLLKCEGVCMRVSACVPLCVSIYARVCF